MKEISEGLRPGIPKQPLMDSCVRAVNLGPGRHASQPASAGRQSGDAPVRHLGRVEGVWAEIVAHKHCKHACCMFAVRAVI